MPELLETFATSIRIILYISKSEKILDFITILPVSTAECERGFTNLSFIKTD